MSDVPASNPAPAQPLDGPLTVNQLMDRLTNIPGDARIFVYVGSNGVSVQAEGMSASGVPMDYRRVLVAPMHIGGGGEAR